MNGQMLRDMVRIFVRSNIQYAHIIDVLVYNDTQYMRMPYSRNALKNIVYKEILTFSKNRDVEIDGNKIKVSEPSEQVELGKPSEPSKPIPVSLFEQALETEHPSEQASSSNSPAHTDIRLEDEGINDLVRSIIRAKNQSLGLTAVNSNENDFHFIYKSTYPLDYDKSVPFIINDVRDCTLYSNRFPHIVFKIDKRINEQKFGVKFGSKDDNVHFLTFSYGSYDMFLFEF